MRLASIRAADHAVIGVVSADQQTVRVLPTALGTVDDVVRGLLPLKTVSAAAANIPNTAIETLEIGPPLTRFNRDILCTGWNYVDHFHESAGRRDGQGPPSMPEHPTFFTKGPDTVIGPHDVIAFDSTLSAKWDYEAELALVIGHDGRSIPEPDALAHVFGYFVANDISQRDLQRSHGGQWLKGKSLDATMPIGPWITTADEISDPIDMTVECELNGELVQHASTKEMAFAIPRLIAELSRGMTLRAGDVLLTGTPSGVGNARTPPVYLTSGDILQTRIKGLGDLKNALGHRS